MPEWQDVRRAADRRVPTLRRLVIRAFNDARATVRLGEIETAVKKQDRWGVEHALADAMLVLDRGLRGDSPLPTSTYFQTLAAKKKGVESVIQDALIAGGNATTVCAVGLDTSKYRDFNQFDVANGELAKRSKTLARNWFITKEQAASISTYVQDPAYLEINTLLRTGQMLPSAEMSIGAVKQHVTNIDAAINGGYLAKPLKLYRGVSDESQFFARLPVGTTFSDAGYVSTSLSEEIAWRHGDDVMIEILHPGGTRAGAYIESLRMGEDFDPVFSNYEFLLPRGTTFKILERRVEGNGIRLVLEVVR